MNRFLLAAVVLCNAFAATPQARAGLVLTLDDPSTMGIIEVIVADNAPIGTLTGKGLSNYADTDFTIGCVVPFIVDTMVGNFLVQSVLTLGSTGSPLLDLSLKATSTGAGSLQAMLTNTGFTLPVATGPMNLLVNGIGGSADGLVTFQGAYDAGNAEFGMSTLSDAMTVGGNPFDATVYTLVPAAAPYSLTIIATIEATGADQMSFFDATADVTNLVPEPATWAVWVCLAGLASAVGLRANKRSRA